MLNFLNLLAELAPVASPSGCEAELAARIAELARPFADEITTDALGNLFVHKKGAGERVLLAAHMDTVGLLATYYDERGFVRFGALGGLTVSDLHNIPVRFANGVPGVVSYETKTKLADRKLAQFYVDIGAESADEARRMVPPGTAAVFTQAPQQLGEHRVMGSYLDNRAGVALLLMLLSDLPECDYDLTFAFTAQEEVGLRGARCAAYAAEPRFALVVDTTDVGDLPESELAMEMRLGAGAAVKIMDRSVMCHPKITQALCALAEKRGIPFQNEVMPDGGTDAGEIHLSRGGVMTGGISIPTRYLHSPCEVADLRDVDAACRLLRAALTERIFF